MGKKPGTYAACIHDTTVAFHLALERLLFWWRQTDVGVHAAVMPTLNCHKCSTYCVFCFSFWLEGHTQEICLVYSVPTLGARCMQLAKCNGHVLLCLNAHNQCSDDWTHSLSRHDANIK